MKRLAFFFGFFAIAVCALATAAPAQPFPSRQITIVVPFPAGALSDVAARILQQPHNLFLVNNKHPMVPQSTLRAAYRLVLHGLASEMLYELLVRTKRAASAHTADPVVAQGKV